MKFVFAILLLGFASQSMAEVHKCISKQGKTSFQSEPCQLEEDQAAVTMATKPRAKARNKSAIIRNTPLGCDYDILGQWKQTHISVSLDQDLIPDSSQKWTLNRNNTILHEGYDGLVKQDFTFSCLADIITFNTEIKNKIKIVRFEGDSMIWESLDFSGYLYLSR